MSWVVNKYADLLYVIFVFICELCFDAMAVLLIVELSCEQVCRFAVRYIGVYLWAMFRCHGSLVNCWVELWTSLQICCTLYLCLFVLGTGNTSTDGAYKPSFLTDQELKHLILEVCTELCPPSLHYTQIQTPPTPPLISRKNFVLLLYWTLNQIFFYYSTNYELWWNWKSSDMNVTLP